MLTDTHTVRSIGTKAIKLNLTQSREWTDKEIDIFKRYYSSVPYDEFKNYCQTVHIIQLLIWDGN